MVPSKKLMELGIELPEPVQPVASYVRWVQTGNLLFISGPAPATKPSAASSAARCRSKKVRRGSRGRLQILATARAALGDLDRVTRVVKVLGMVNCTPDFGDQPKVINGCSDLFIEVFGDAGQHTRSAVGFVALPNQIPVEIECTMEVR